MNRREVLISGATIVSSPLISPLLAIAQAKYPERPIKLLVAFSAGGVNDVVGRQWADRMTEFARHRLCGKSGRRQRHHRDRPTSARAQPDGHTILLGSTSTMVLNPMTMGKVPYDPVKDFTPVGILAVSTTSIVVHASVPAESLKELIAYAKANPGKLTYGSAGAGTMSNLSGELFKQLTGLTDLVHVPYRGAGPGITDLVSGHIPMMTPNITGQVLELHRAGKIRILSVNGPERLKAAPDIPTAIEQGVPNMIGLLFLGLFVPVATPKAIVDQIGGATRKLMADEAFQKVLTDAGLEGISDSDSEKAKQFMEEELVRWEPVVKAAGMKAQ